MSVMKETKEKVETTVLDDYENRPVPADKCFGWYQQGAVWLGCGFCLAAFSHAPSRLVLPCRRFFSLKKLLKNLLTFHTLYSWRNRCYFFTVCSISY